MSDLARSDYAFPDRREGPLNDVVAVRETLACFGRVKDASDEERDEAWARVVAAAKRFGVDVREADWRDLTD